MRDPERISPILDKLGQYWYANPDLRLGQILANAAGEMRGDPDPFFIEEDDLSSYLDKEIAHTYAMQALKQYEEAQNDFNERFKQ